MIVAPFNCRACGYLCDTISALTTNELPDSGFLNVCSACGEPSIIARTPIGIDMRALTDEELAAVAVTPEYRQVQAALRATWRRHGIPGG